MKAVFVFPDGDVIDNDIEVERLPLSASEYTLESLYPERLRFKDACSRCSEVHSVWFKRVGFRLHDDSSCLVYELDEFTTPHKKEEI